VSHVHREKIRLYANKQGKFRDVIHFIESPAGLKMTISPAQKVIFKTFYGLPLDVVEDVV